MFLKYAKRFKDYCKFILILKPKLEDLLKLLLIKGMSLEELKESLELARMVKMRMIRLDDLKLIAEILQTLNNQPSRSRNNRASA